MRRAMIPLGALIVAAGLLTAAYALRDRPGRLTIDQRPANPGQVLAFLTE